MVLVDQSLQAGPPRAVDLDQLAHRVQGQTPQRILVGVVVAQHEPDLLIHRDTQPEQLVGIGRQLQQCSDLRVPRELGVVDGVRVVTADDEVGTTVETSVEERPLDDHIGARLESGNRLHLLGNQRRPVVRLWDRDLGNTPREPRYVVPVGGEVARENAVLVDLAEPCRALEHRVALQGQSEPAELRVQPAQQPELAVGSHREVTRAVDHQVLEQEQRFPLCLSSGRS